MGRPRKHRLSTVTGDVAYAAASARADALWRGDSLQMARQKANEAAAKRLHEASPGSKRPTPAAAHKLIEDTHRAHPEIARLRCFEPADTEGLARGILMACRTKALNTPPARLAEAVRDQMLQMAHACVFDHRLDLLDGSGNPNRQREQIERFEAALEEADRRMSQELRELRREGKASGPLAIDADALDILISALDGIDAWALLPLTESDTTPT
jgi:hypothetical protein